jgi:hypothetical protein
LDGTQLQQTGADESTHLALSRECLVQLVIADPASIPQQFAEPFHFWSVPAGISKFLMLSCLFANETL